MLKIFEKESVALKYRHITLEEMTYEIILYLEISITLQTAACMIASNPPSGVSILAEIRCPFTISLNFSASFVRGKTFLYPKVGKHSYGTLLQEK